jgi:hypothetical protein
MSEELPSPDMSLALDHPESLPVVGEWLLGTSGLLAHHQGDKDTAELIAEVQSLDVRLWDTEFGVEDYKIVLVVEPHLYRRYGEAELGNIADAMRAVLTSSGKGIDIIDVRPTLPRQIGADWRKQLKDDDSTRPSNHASRIKFEPRHPSEDGLHFTNEWEWRVYRVLKERQAALPDNETIGILPLPAMKVLKSVPVEPDFLITYRGRVGIIEVDGPHHKGRRSDDHSRERLLRNAGIKQIDRIDVRDVKKEDVEKFVIDFLKHLAS